MNIIEALHAERVLGALAHFRVLTSWAAWLTFIRAVYGLPMDAEDLERFRRHTGRTTPAPGGYAEAACIVGRQAGKSQVAAVLACWEAATTQARRGGHVLLIAQDLRGAQRALLGYCREVFAEVPALARELERQTADTMELRNGTSLSVYPCRPAAARGVRSPLVILDELAFMQSTEGNPVDREMLRAVRPTLATTAGRLIILSSPYAQAGALWDLHRQHYGREDSGTLMWQASAPEMNPTLASDYLVRMEQDDPEAYRSEVLGEFRAGLTTLFDPEAIGACVGADVRERAPQAGGHYVAFADAASGSGKDAFTLAIAHPDGERVVLDVVRAWQPPFNPSGAIGEAADLLKGYGLREVTGDRYAAGFVIEGFRSNGIVYQHSERDRSALYLELLPAVNAGSVVLLDHPDLLRELRGLERRRGTAGRDRVDHRPGSHDDQANAAAGALVLAVAMQRRSSLKRWDCMTGEIISGVWDGLEWRNGQPWAGVCPADRDPKGRAINYPAVYEGGHIVRYLVPEK